MSYQFYQTNLKKDQLQTSQTEISLQYLPTARPAYCWACFVFDVHLTTVEFVLCFILLYLENFTTHYVWCKIFLMQHLSQTKYIIPELFGNAKFLSIYNTPNPFPRNESSKKKPSEQMYISPEFYGVTFTSYLDLSSPLESSVLVSVQKAGLKHRLHSWR